MQVKVFESTDMTSGLRMVRRELGPDALILSTRTVRNSKLGILGKSMLEITAAIDDSPRGVLKTKPNTAVPTGFQGAAHHTYATSSGQQRNQAVATRRSRQLLQQRTGSPPPTPKPEQPSVPVAPADRFPQRSDDLEELKTMVRNLAGEVTRLKHAAPILPSAASPVAAVAPVPTDPLLELLREQGVNHQAAATIGAYAREALSIQELADPERVNDFLHQTIAGLLQLAPFDFTAEGPQRIALVGPTGVGKTTTLAKLAARYLAARSASVAFITIDTYRIAAVEQLKVYGEIMRLPVEVVISPEQLGQALDKHRDRELVLIDTAGRSPRDQLSVEELAHFFQTDFGIEKNLVLSAVTRETEIMESLTRFGTIGIDKTIFTKIDECTSLGVLLNTQIENGTPLACLTNGQRVPEDLLDIDPGIVSRLIIPPAHEPMI